MADGTATTATHETDQPGLVVGRIPQHPGWYWVRCDSQTRGEVVYLHLNRTHGGAIHTAHAGILEPHEWGEYAEPRTHWYGPLQPPPCLSRNLREKGK